MEKRTGILGAGGWGITLARILDGNGTRVILWEPIRRNFEILAERRENRDYFPGFRIPETVTLTCSLEEAVSESDTLIIVVRSAFFRETAAKLKKSYRNQPVIIGTKGIETATGMRMSQVLADETASDIPLGILSGPTIAKEVAGGMPSAAVIAASSVKTGRRFQDMLNCDTLRIYTSTDVSGVETGGAFKNVIAIGSGIIDGLRLGINTKASYLTRGLNEMIKIGCALGGRERTFRGLSGIGDLITTSFSKYSRNRSFGEAIIETGRDEYLRKSKMVIEGVPTTEAFHRLAGKMDIELPITASLYSIIYGKADPEDEIEKLMRRKTGEE